MLASVYKSHKFHQLKVRVITESTMFPPGKEAAGAAVAVVGFHLLQAVLESVKSQSSLYSGYAIKAE